MTPIKFIEKAIEGGWKPLYEGVETENFSIDDGDFYVQETGKEASVEKRMYIEAILLDFKAWQAVGKTDGWGVCGQKGCGNSWGHENVPESEKKHWQHNMHRMIDSLAEGKTIEEFLKTL